jgi:hypothetical protein
MLEGKDILDFQHGLQAHPAGVGSFGGACAGYLWMHYLLFSLLCERLEHRRNIRDSSDRN